MPASILEVSQVRSGYGSGDILQGISLGIDEGEIVAVIGRNGVGKTTLMKTVIGLLRPSAGTIRFLDEDVTARPARERSVHGIGYVPQGRLIFPQLTVRENLLTGEQVNRGSRERRLRYDLVYEYFPILRDKRSQLGDTLSGGQQQMLAIGRALVGSPKLSAPGRAFGRDPAVDHPRNRRGARSVEPAREPHHPAGGAECRAHRGPLPSGLRDEQGTGRCRPGRRRQSRNRDRMIDYLAL